MVIIIIIIIIDYGDNNSNVKMMRIENLQCAVCVYLDMLKCVDRFIALVGIIMIFFYTLPSCLKY